jgi:hypothetical protein
VPALLQEGATVKVLAAHLDAITFDRIGFACRWRRAADKARIGALVKKALS